MATDKPITGFDILEAADVESDDILVIVDVHDEDQSPSGSTKQVTLASIFDSVDTIAVSGLSTLAKIKGGGATPTVSVIAGSATAVSITGTDVAGHVSCQATGTQLTLRVTFSAAYASTPFVQVSPGNGPSAAAVPFPFIVTTATVDIPFHNAVSSGTFYEFYYQVTA